MEHEVAPASLTGKRRIAVNTLANAAAQLASVLASFLFLPLLVRAFGLAGFGLYMLAASVTGYVLLLDFGVGATVVRMVAERAASSEPDRIAGVLASAAAVYGAIGLAAAALMAAVAVLGGSVFAVDAMQAATLRTLLFVGAAFQLVYWPASTARHALAGLQRYDLVARTAIASTLGSIACMVAVLVTGGGPVMLTVLNGLVVTSASLVNIALVSRLLRGSGGRATPHLESARSIVRSGAPIFLVQVAQVISRQYTDRLVLGVLVGPSAVGLYEIAAKLGQLVTQASDLVVSALLPVAAGLSARRDEDTMRALFLRGARYTVAAIVPIASVLVVIAGPFVRAWFGPGFETSVPVAQALVLSQMLVPLYLIGDPILVGKNRYVAWMPWALSLAVVNLVLSVVLVRSFGLVGVALGTLVACLLEFPVYGRVILREVGVGWGRWLRSAAWPAYPLLVVPVGVAWTCLRTPLAGSMWGLFVVGAVSVMLYWALAWLSVLGPQERQDLVRVGRELLAGAPAGKGGVS